ncbi:hypothetical protein [Sinorhizobium sp. BG8]|uniref:hypothetical protein n=1 Tax=Sinorhizobium sp. BG8 TaxID=2613773 RepID=UPI00193E8D6F|nr:hypothetical protein [Sinorhizobium sp. BG8]QRM53260.1 hypothetical protein F3Y30_00760 [Sinorhizobium sp. BG8]
MHTRRGDESSVPIIEEYLDTHDWPIDTLAEAAHAHWQITHSLKYLSVLREAKKQGAAGNTESALKEMEKLSRGQKGKTTARKTGDHRKPTAPH